MQITILGAGTSVPVRDAGPPAILVQLGDNDRLLLDCGPGAVQKLSHAGLPFYLLDCVFLTHRHLDHTGDLPFLLFAKRNRELPANHDLKVFGPEGILEMFAGWRRMFGHWVEADQYRLTVAELPADGVHTSGWRLESFRVPHTEHSVGFRLKETGGGVLAYTGDTGYGPAVVDLARGADLLIAECSLPDGYEVEGHLTPGLVGKIAAEAGVKRLILTHIYPVLHHEEAVREVCRVYPGPTQAARDLDSISI